jgi:hypothetical protein
VKWRTPDRTLFKKGGEDYGKTYHGQKKGGQEESDQEKGNKKEDDKEGS